MENLMESLQEIPNLNLIIMVAAGVIIGIILFRVAQRILKTILIVAVIGLAYFFWQGGTVDELGQKGIDLFFKESRIDNMVDVNCPDQKAEKAKCDCVVIPTQKDLRNKFSISELAMLDKDWESLRREIGKSMQENEKEIRQCLLNNHGKKYIENISGIFENLKEGTKSN
ncbi:MAG: hypothetical protein MRZ79_11580 [Bacteroidia bacterium]|nr:hypothetical protein [Bacteroidia bacterium]